MSSLKLFDSDSESHNCTICSSNYRQDLENQIVRVDFTNCSVSKSSKCQVIVRTGEEEAGAEAETETDGELNYFV